MGFIVLAMNMIVLCRLVDIILSEIVQMFNDITRQTMCNK